jgi:hypothetical protein
VQHFKRYLFPGDGFVKTHHSDGSPIQTKAKPSPLSMRPHQGAEPPLLSLDEPFSPDPRSRDDYRSTQKNKKKETNDADRELPPVEDRTLADIFGG